MQAAGREPFDYLLILNLTAVTVIWPLTEDPEKPWRQRCAAVPASRSVNQDCSRDLSDEVAPMAYATSDSSDGVADDADSDSIIRVAVFWIRSSDAISVASFPAYNWM